MKKSGARQPNLFLICVHCIVFALNIGLGINIGFIVDTWLQPVLQLIPWGMGPLTGAIIALISGGLIGVGAYGLFIESERAWKTIWMAKTSNWEAGVRTIALVLVNLIWITIGILGLVYRLQFLNQHGVIFLFWIGVLLECSQPLFGLVLYPMKHRPAEMVEDESQESFRSGHMEDLYVKLESLPIDKRHAAYVALEKGDKEAVRAILQEQVEHEERDRRAAAQAQTNEKRAKELQKQNKSKQSTGRRVFTGPPTEDGLQDFPNAQGNNKSQADSLSHSSNGHRQ